MFRQVRKEPRRGTSSRLSGSGVVPSIKGPVGPVSVSAGAASKGVHGVGREEKESFKRRMQSFYRAEQVCVHAVCTSAFRALVSAQACVQFTVPPFASWSLHGHLVVVSSGAGCRNQKMAVERQCRDNSGSITVLDKCLEEICNLSFACQL